jgi:hypothetical protein
MLGRCLSLRRCYSELAIVPYEQEVVKEYLVKADLAAKRSNSARPKPLRYFGIYARILANSWQFQEG